MKLGSLREDLHYTMDREYFLRFWLSGIRPCFVGEHVLALERRYPEQKSNNKPVMYKEYTGVLKNYFNKYMHGNLLNIIRLFWYWRKYYYSIDGIKGLFARSGLSDAEYYTYKFMLPRFVALSLKKIIIFSIVVYKIFKSKGKYGK
jgi:hypothetical protein